jgi:multiple sugar transport system permease protein
MIYISFFNYNMARGTQQTFIGLNNYQEMLSDYIVHDSVEFSVFIILTGMILETALGLGLALLIIDSRGETLYRSISILPMTIPMVVSGMVWKMLLNTIYGPVNYFLSFLGVPQISWLGDPIFARLAILMVDIWQWTPFMFLILYAGVKNAPGDLIEAALVDGASGWQISRYIRLPLVMPLVTIAVLLRLVELLKLFDIVYMITGGGPGTVTYSFSYLIYVVGFLTGINLGYASALSVILLICALALTALLIKTLNVKRLLGLEEKV